MEIKVRIAPSPTGYLHIGTARTALFNWLFAKKNGGKFVLRIEDTDLERSDKKYEDNIIEGLRWLGLDWDEFYRQSERIEVYKKYIEQLLEEKKAFWCYHSQEELEEEKNEQMKKKEAPRHVCEHKEMQSAKCKAQSANGIIRLAVDENLQRVIHFKDLIRGTIEFEQRVIGDLSIAKDVGVPLYNFAVVVDDHETKISHVIRGEDHISNTPKQILIAEALGFSLPEFAHMPMILGTDKSKLSKRHGATDLIEYKKDYLPDALVNFISSIGYTYSKEISNLDEMMKEFELSKVHKSGAVFNVEKLNWLNGQYVKKLSFEELKELTDIKKLPEKALPLVTERLEKLSDINNFNYFWEEPEYDASLLVWKKSNKEHAKLALELLKELFDREEKINAEDLKLELDKIAEDKFGGDRGAVYWPLRVALTGKEFSPDPVQIVSVLTKETVLDRVEKALRKLI